MSIENYKLNLLTFLKPTKHLLSETGTPRFHARREYESHMLGPCTFCNGPAFLEQVENRLSTATHRELLIDLLGNSNMCCQHCFFQHDKCTITTHLEECTLTSRTKTLIQNISLTSTSVLVQLAGPQTSLILKRTRTLFSWRTTSHCTLNINFPVCQP